MSHRRPAPCSRAARLGVLVGAGALALGAIGYGVGVIGEGPSIIPGPRTGGALAPQAAANGVDQAGAQWSPASDANYRPADRPNDYDIDRIVVHVTQSTAPIAEQVFRDPGHRAAAHYLVRADDGRITQMVREHDVAYHAGNWDWNNRSIGIEHEGFVDQPDRWFTDAAYRASARLVADIAARHDIPLTREHIVGHNEVPGATHTDPGPYWDWDRCMNLIQEI
ncbi:N-acetylmuramoyl-L-alanine amidase [Streptomyces scopuliridis]|uniref:N-acetylmuramoyl-L-alanine amidase n=1 Tax=Streptomyces scopuliridis TaxID=452529 RepID=A0ACD4ZYQ6_9ACTN|nr:N-acetylmuramoyl-L-alanine amidase [Streptomyces scopuliridis]WSC11084.1 N-acetylmuramoyl-L-alanine amidase [Streptomyces scopuliridis]